MARTGWRQSLPALLLSLFVSTAVGACGGGGDQSASEDTASSDTTLSTETTAVTGPAGGGGKSGTGAPIGRPSGGATGAPVKIPAITQLQGVRLDERLTLPGNPTLLEHIRNKFRDACGGSLCVTLRIVDEKGRTQGESCKFQRLDPNFGEDKVVTVPRGSVVKIVVSDCPGASTDGDPPTSEQAPNDQP